MKATVRSTAIASLVVTLLLLSRITAAEPAITHTENSAKQSNASLDLIMAPSTIAAYNWSGYVADTDTYSGVSSTWVVPRVGNLYGNGADATWVGIGGVSSNDLIQAGTEALPDGAGGSSYAAWYEVLPQDSMTVPMRVSPGDSVTVTIVQQSSGMWLISFHNNTTGGMYQRRVGYNSSLSSAEWIEEMPVSPDSPIALDDFGSVNFSASYALVNGSWIDVAQTGAKALRMDNGSHEALAVPSKLTAGGVSFTVVRTKAAAKPLQFSGGNVRPPSQYSPAPQSSYDALSRMVHRMLGR